MKTTDGASGDPLIRALILFAAGMAVHEIMMRWARGHPGRAALVVGLQSWRTWRALSGRPPAGPVPISHS